MRNGLKISLTLLLVTIIQVLAILFITFIFAMAISLCERTLNSPIYNLIIAIVFSVWFILSSLILFILIRKSTYKLPYKLSFIVIGIFICILNKTFINGFRYEYPEFQSNEWKSNPNSRWDMAPGIINRGDLKNKCKTEIERNLGLPDENFENVWTYELGFGNLVINYYNDCFKNAYIACR